MDNMEKINLSTLRNTDPCIEGILAQSSAVALYEFNSVKQAWDKTDKEGTLFLYKREAQPLYGFSIVNRLNPLNLVQPLTKDMNFKIEHPFLLYKNNFGGIFGIWFHDKDECSSIGGLVESLMNEVEGKGKVGRNQMEAGSRGSNHTERDRLSSLLNNAGANNSTKNEAELANAAAGEEHGRYLMRLLSQPEPSAAQVPGDPTIPAPLPTSQGGTAVQSFFRMVSSSNMGEAQDNSPAFRSLALGDGEMVGRAGVHSLDAVEAEQRSNTSSVSPQALPLPSLEQQLKQSLHIGEHKQEQEAKSLTEPTLISPHMFNTQARVHQKDRSPRPLQNGESVFPPDAPSLPSPPVLSPSQMVEAVTHLLETDQAFVEKLHQAYARVRQKQQQTHSRLNFS